ncbi:anaerobic ribonucleoside-triphosphate reductase [Pyrococcus yayanosii]|uniref:Naerobic ribonucleoside triphosphate reductase n=1 Tax=Pyrococcus yayanosii (strain CH1 / JCM 16557) TaxID=529709 RepID=F8AHN3_PYRYC|nr:anaerobic ribonucleoside-triphosphate reductase [Pyrococcus yayanosii]AEH25406.1 naerobic ribonucleoside triphosphate reductase [Pyrococcus yayanosii CH1]
MEIVKKDIIQEYASWSNLDVLENANRYPGPTGFFAYVMEEALKESILLIPKGGREAHFSGDIYIHKLPYSLYIPYCTGHSTARLLEKGLKTPTIASRPARHFDTYVDHIANYLITMQHHFSGAQALSSVEWYAGPFIRKDGLDRRKIRQQIQRLVYNLNYPSRVGMQTPFTNFTVTLDTPKKMLEGDHAVYDGKKLEPLGEYEREAKEFFIALTTVNLPRLALKARGDDDRFWEEYERILETVKMTTDWFRERYVRLITNYRQMYQMIHLYLEEFPSSHFNTIGILGLPEAAVIYLNEPELWTEGSRRGWLKAAEVMKEMVEFATAKAREWMRKTGTPWNVEEVPGESAAAKLAIRDLREFPELKEYLSDPENSIYSTSVAPYYGSLELADRIRIEEKVQRSFTGGVMMHIFLGEEPDPEALAKLTKRLMKTDLVYWSYTPAVTVCNDCKFSTTGLHTHCPRCGSENVEIWSRIIGYYRPLRNWNPFRKKEFWMRRHYSS